MIIPSLLVATEFSIIPWFFTKSSRSIFPFILTLSITQHRYFNITWKLYLDPCCFLSFMLVDCTYCLNLVTANMCVDPKSLCLVHWFPLHFILRYKASCWLSLSGWPKGISNVSYPILALSVVEITSDLIEQMILVDTSLIEPILQQIKFVCFFSMQIFNPAPPIFLFCVILSFHVFWPITPQ